METKTVGSYEAKTHLPALLDAVEHGDKVIITRRGTPIAILMPYKETSDSIDETINALLEFRKGRSLKGLLLNDLKNQGKK